MTTARADRRATPAALTDEIGAIVPGGAACGILPPAALDVAAHARRRCASGAPAPARPASRSSPPRTRRCGCSRETMRFFAEESCQKCTPCRIGNRALEHLFERLEHGEATMQREQLDEWLLAMEKTSICGLGQAAPFPCATRCATGRSCSRRSDAGEVQVASSAMVEFTLDGNVVSAPEGELLVHAAARHGTLIPTLCHDDKLDPYGGCRMCVVDVEGAPRPVPACASASARAWSSRRTAHVPQLPRDADRDAARRAPERRSRRPAERAHRPRATSSAPRRRSSSPTRSASRTRIATG